MTQAELEERLGAVRDVLGYYDQQVLASYRNESTEYLIETDSFEGTLTLTNSYYATLSPEQSDSEYLRVRFGYRTLADGQLALVVIVDDLSNAKAHRDKWLGFLLKNATWLPKEDARFEKWFLRYIEGSWDVDCGPKRKLIEQMATINGLTSERLGIPLFKHVVQEFLSFPAAENTHKYQDAHAALYGYLIDGIDKHCLEMLAPPSGNQTSISSDNTIKALKRILPELGNNSQFLKALSRVSEQRRLASHGVRPPAQPFTAFSAFTDDLSLCAGGCAELLSILESRLGANGPAAKRRADAKSRLLTIVGAVYPNASLHGSKEMEGKTIVEVKYGQRETIEQVHESECLNIYFTDGSILQIDTGSNVTNLCSDRRDLAQNQFHVDFILHWVPALIVDQKEGS